jgi:hypothetical protein
VYFVIITGIVHEQLPVCVIITGIVHEDLRVFVHLCRLIARDLSILFRTSVAVDLQFIFKYRSHCDTPGRLDSRGVN